MLHLLLSDVIHVKLHQKTKTISHEKICIIDDRYHLNYLNYILHQHQY